MANAVESTGNGNWASDAATCWDLGSRPGDSHDVIIKNGHNITITQAERANSFKIEAGGTLTVSSGSDQAITVDNEGDGNDGTTNGYAVDIDGAIVNAAAGKFDLIIETQAETALDLSPSSGNVNNLTINHASCDAGVDSSCTLTGNIEVTAGILELTNYTVSAVLVHGNGEVQIGGSATYTTTNDWRPDNTKLISNGATINIGDQMGGAWNCNDKQAAINCKRLHSTVSMTNGDGRIADNTQENIVGTVTSNEANASVYGPLQGAWKFVTNSSGTKSFALRENFVIEGRMLITGSGVFTTTYSSVDYDILTTPKTYHTSLTGPSDFGNSSGTYHGIEIRDTVDFDTGNSNVILNQALGSELCDDGDFNSGGTGNWVAYSGNTIANDSNTLKVSRPASGGHANGAYVYLRNNTNLTTDLTIGRTYKVSADFKVSAGASITAGLYKGTLDLNKDDYGRMKTSGGGADQITSTSFETRVAYFVAGSSTSDSPYIYFGMDGGMSNGEDVFVDNISVKEVLPHNDGTHQMSWGFRQYSGVAPNFGGGCLITSGFRVASNLDVTKTSGDFITNGAGDSTEYWNFGSGTIDMNMSGVYVTTTMNPNETNTIGYNHSSSDLNLTCSRHNWYAPFSTNHLALWQTTAPVGTTGDKTFTIDGELHIYKGIFRTGYHSGSRYPMGLAVTGLVKIYGDGTLDCSVDNSTTNANNENDVDVSFGTLEVESGGTYNAAGGDASTTITTGGTVDGTSDTAFGGEGTFTHNNGTLVLDSVLHRIPRGGTFYNVKMTGSQNTGGLYAYSNTMLPQGIMPDGTTGAAYLSILGTLEITDDEFRPYNADKVYIHNLVIGDGTGSANSAKFDFSEVDTFDGTVYVDNVTIHSDGQLLFGDGDETSATEGSSALNIYGAFRKLGGSVDIA